MSILIKHQDMPKEGEKYLLEIRHDGTVYDAIGHRAAVIATQFDESASPWHRVEEPPKQAGEYIVAYHPCYWDNVVTKVTKVGIDNFRGKSAWAKKKHQRVTHWMDKPEPPKEDA